MGVVSRSWNFLVGSRICKFYSSVMKLWTSRKKLLGDFTLFMNVFFFLWMYFFFNNLTLSNEMIIILKDHLYFFTVLSFCNISYFLICSIFICHIHVVLCSHFPLLLQLLCRVNIHMSALHFLMCSISSPPNSCYKVLNEICCSSFHPTFVYVTFCFFLRVWFLFFVVFFF